MHNETSNLEGVRRTCAECGGTFYTHPGYVYCIYGKGRRLWFCRWNHQMAYEKRAEAERAARRKEMPQRSERFTGWRQTPTLCRQRIEECREHIETIRAACEREYDTAERMRLWGQAAYWRKRLRMAEAELERWEE